MYNRKIGLLTIICLLLLTQIPHVHADNNSREIDRIEIGENCKTIYYKDGSKELFVTLSATLHFSSSANTIVSKVVSPEPQLPIDIIDKIYKIIKQVSDSLNDCAAGSTLLAWTIWSAVRRLRRGRPKDYRGVIGMIYRPLEVCQM